MIFKCLYSFSSKEIDLTEIKRTDLASEAPLSELYRWLIIQKKEAHVTPLTFESMSKEGEDELRCFNEGELRFNKFSGELLWNDERYILECIKSENVSESSIRLMKEFLS